MKMKLEPLFETVRTGKTIGIAHEVVTVQNLRYVDLDNISKYSKRDVFSILCEVRIFTNPNYSKKVLVDMLFRNNEAIEKIKMNNRLYNREKNLNNLI